MTISLTLTADNAADLYAQMRALLGTTAVVAPNSGPGGGAEAPKATRAAAKPAEPKPEPETPVANEVKTEEVQPPADDDGTAIEVNSPLTYEADIKPMVLKVSAKHGRPGVEKLLADFGVANASAIQQDRWPELLAAVDKLLG